MACLPVKAFGGSAFPDPETPCRMHHANCPQTQRIADVKPENKPERIKKTRWFICLIVWWVAAVFFYLFIAAHENNRVGRVTAAGIKIILVNAEQAGLPLLEQNVQALTRLTQDATQGEGGGQCFHHRSQK